MFFSFMFSNLICVILSHIGETIASAPESMKQL
jgi:hypothetical protein